MRTHMAEALSIVVLLAALLGLGYASAKGLPALPPNLMEWTTWIGVVVGIAAAVPLTHALVRLSHHNQR